jgi:hypothetical protein
MFTELEKKEELRKRVKSAEEQECLGDHRRAGSWSYIEIDAGQIPQNLEKALAWSRRL